MVAIDAVREATMAKYQMTWKWVAKLVPQLKISELTQTAYQQLLNDYAKEHERQTTLDFHHQLKGAIQDAVDDGLLEWDPFLLLVAKTGMRFSEALAVIPSDFDFARQTLSVSKTWDYKGEGGFLPTHICILSRSWKTKMSIW